MGLVISQIHSLPKKGQYSDNSLKTNLSWLNDCNLSSEFRFHAIGTSDLCFFVFGGFFLEFFSVL